MNTTETIVIPAAYGTKCRDFGMFPIHSELTKWQLKKADAFNATHYFTTDDIRFLPAYKVKALEAAGWEAVKIGHTSYKSATWGARRVA